MTCQGELSADTTTARSLLDKGSCTPACPACGCSPLQRPSASSRSPALPPEKQWQPPGPPCAPLPLLQHPWPRPSRSHSAQHPMTRPCDLTAQLCGANVGDVASCVILRCLLLQAWNRSCWRRRPSQGHGYSKEAIMPPYYTHVHDMAHSTGQTDESDAYMLPEMTWRAHPWQTVTQTRLAEGFCDCPCKGVTHHARLHVGLLLPQLSCSRLGDRQSSCQL